MDFLCDERSPAIEKVKYKQFYFVRAAFLFGKIYIIILSDKQVSDPEKSNQKPICRGEYHNLLDNLTFRYEMPVSNRKKSNKTII